MLLGLAAITLTDCAGHPPGQVASSQTPPKHCERVTGSMLCADYDDSPMGTAKDPSVLEHFQGTPGSK